MKFIKIKPEQAAETLATTLIEALKKYNTVTWFVPGGSNIGITVAAMAAIPEELTGKLIIAQTDERYGPMGHKDSNWQQLIDAGFELKNANAQPVLTLEPLPLAETAQIYANKIRALEGMTYKIGQFGIGADSHIAGIKPGSPASVAEGLAAGYEAEDFQRVTMTFTAIRQLNEAHAFVFGEAKRAALSALANESHQPMLQPAQILKSNDKSFIYNDLLEG